MEKTRLIKRYPPGHVSLERALSKLGIASRTEARRWILDGRVLVNGRVAQSPTQAVVPERAKIEIQGQAVSQAEPLTLLLHKPKGVVTTRSDEKGRPTVFSILQGVDQYLLPVGRLDFATTGLLLLTNDTQFSAWITDPKNEVPRVYLATVRGEFRDETAQRLQAGIQDKEDRLQASRITVRKRSGRESHLVIELQEGKNREIRRMLLAVGHEVTALKRVSFGGLELGDLAPGSWRKLSLGELQQAFPGAPLRDNASNI